MQDVYVIFNQEKHNSGRLSPIKADEWSVFPECDPRRGLHVSGAYLTLDSPWSILFKLRCDIRDHIKDTLVVNKKTGFHVATADEKVRLTPMEFAFLSKFCLANADTINERMYLSFFCTASHF